MVANFEAKLNEYAHLLVEVGLNVQKGQIPRISSPVECAPLARLCAAAALDCGAKDVFLEWNDDFIARQRYLKADESVFTVFPDHVKAKMEWMVENSCPSLAIIGSDPEALKGVDANRIQTWQRVSGKGTKVWRDALDAGNFQWTIGAHPTRAWAEKVFPDKKGEAAIDALWDAIFSVCRITGDGKGVERWKEHVENTARRSKILNDFNFKSLHYTNSKGTDLTIELPENHIWAGGADRTNTAVEYVANMPTEEIFSAPLKTGVNGVVYAAMPLVEDGNVIRDFHLVFKDGKIVEVHAKEGEEVLKNSIAVDEGAAYLGEVALIPYDSPISNQKILYYETLFDENASCHLAYGAAYPCIAGGNDMSDEELKDHGLNVSSQHTDFMIGTSDLSIVGTTHDGKEIEVFKNGNFCF